MPEVAATYPVNGNESKRALANAAWVASTSVPAAAFPAARASLLTMAKSRKQKVVNGDVVPLELLSSSDLSTILATPLLLETKRA